MSMSMLIDEEGNHRVARNGVIGSKPGMGIPDSEKELLEPARAKIVEAERNAEQRRKQTSPITEAQGDRIIVLLTELLRAHGRNPPTA